MGYFRVNERYLGGEEDSRVDPPWGVQAQEAGRAGGVRLTWRRPYTAVEGYSVIGQPDGAAEGHELLRVPDTASEAVLHLGPGRWHLAVQARRGATASPLSEAVVWNVEQGIGVGGWGLEVRAGTEISPASTDVTSLPTPPAAVVQPQTPIPQPPTPPAEPHCPVAGCGARVAGHPDGSVACVYCGCRVAITLDGRALAVDQLLYGACTCCVPQRPLIRQGDHLVCPARPQQRYGVPLPLGDGRNEPDSPPAPPPPGVTAEPAPEFDWNAIDTALRDNSAQLGRHGLFVRPRR